MRMGLRDKDGRRGEEKRSGKGMRRKEEVEKGIIDGRERREDKG